MIYLLGLVWGFSFFFVIFFLQDFLECRFVSERGQAGETQVHFMSESVLFLPSMLMGSWSGQTLRVPGLMAPEPRSCRLLWRSRSVLLPLCEFWALLSVLRNLKNPQRKSQESVVLS